MEGWCRIETPKPEHCVQFPSEKHESKQTAVVQAENEHATEGRGGGAAIRRQPGKIEGIGGMQHENDVAGAHDVSAHARGNVQPFLQ